jgi:CRISPR-associated endonuclease/helicase Cas3
MSLLLSFWAKLGNETWPEKYHPVLCHLIDVGQVGRRLWDDVCRSQVREWVTNRLGLPDRDAAGAWLAFWAAAHDIGKVSPVFQAQGKTDKLKRHLPPEFSFDCFNDNKKHGAYSTKILFAELMRGTDWPMVDRPAASAVAVAVGGHHGLFPTDWDGISSPLGNENWADARRLLLADLARLFGVADLPAPKPPTPDDQSVWMYLAGFTSVADWIGSNQEFFEPVGNQALVDNPFDLDNYFGESKKHAADALEKLGWLGRAHTTTPVTFAALFPRFPPRPLQEAVEKIAVGMSEPSLLIVEAPMGEGKTEAAWYVADVWDRAGGQGTYVALPTMATSNQMFERVGKFLEAGAGKKNLMLTHGKSALNANFEKLKYAASVYDDDKQPSAVVAEQWFAANKKHGLLAPYGVGTIDQALLAVLQTKHVFVRLFGLAGKCVILDEVHAYDAYMTTLMERLLRWLAALRCPVVLLSATLPRNKRLQLMKAYAGDALPEPDDVPYPRVTCVGIGDKRADVRHFAADPNRAQTIQLGWLDESALAETLRQSLADGGCAAVIRNTVGLAQETYKQLRDVLTADGIVVELFHARFPYGRRREIEEAVLKRFGVKGGPAERDKRVLVATQVIEQSLDLDFDVMISDVAPVDLVLQRAGRLHRHARGRRPPGVAEARLWLIEPQTGDDQIPDFGGSGFVYSRYVLFRSLLVLLEKGEQLRTAIELPNDIDNLIKTVYEEADPPARLTDPERAFWDQSKADHEAALDKEKDEAESRRIRKPKHTGNLARLVGVPREEDNPDLHPAHQALTRLSRPTAQLICLEVGSAGAFRLIHDQSPISTLAVRKMSAGGVEDVTRLLLGELATAHPGVVRELWGSPRRPSPWEKVGMLCRHHQIVFVNGRAMVGKYELLVDNEVGLQVVQTDEQGEDE